MKASSQFTGPVGRKVKVRAAAGIALTLGIAAIAGMNKPATATAPPAIDPAPATDAAPAAAAVPAADSVMVMPDGTVMAASAMPTGAANDPAFAAIANPVTQVGDPPAVGGSSSAGFTVSCPYSHTLFDDPIVFPGQAGKSHEHDFLGATSTNAGSTNANMAPSATKTTCAAKADHSPYWTPTLRANGTVVHPTQGTKSSAGVAARQTIYYRNPPGLKVRAIPAGLRMISGVSMAKSVAENPHLGHDIWWGCSDNSISTKLTEPPAHCKTGIITLHLHFPNCWDGQHLDSPDHQSHMAWPKSGHCPADHPVLIPRVTIRNEYVVGTTTGTITLGSGKTFTIHGDFWNQWDQKELERLTAKCFNAGVNCGKLEG